MAYQPIEMGGFQGFGIAEAMHQARQEQRQKQQEAWNHFIQQGEGDRAQQRINAENQQTAFNQARLRQSDVETGQDRMVKIHEHIQRLHEAGLSHEAQQLAELYGLHGTQEDAVSGPRVGQVYGSAMGQQGAQSFKDATAGVSQQADQELGRDNPDALEPMQGQRQGGGLGTAFVDQAEGKRASLLLGPSGEDEVNVPGGGIYHEGQTVPIEGPVESPPGGPQAPAPQQAPPEVPQGPDPVQAAMAQYQQHPTYRYQGPDGVNFTVDPQEHEQAQLTQNQRLAERFKSVFQADPGLAPYAGEFAARVQLGEQPGAAFQDLKARQIADAKEHQQSAENAKYKNQGLTFDQMKELARIKAAAAGAPKELPEAANVGEEMNKAFAEVNDKKEGLAARQHHLQGSLNEVQKQPNNPSSWTNYVDALVRTNTGKAAIIAQYKLYTGKAGGTLDQAASWLQQNINGNLGEAVKKNLLQSGQGAMNELVREGGAQKHVFRSTYPNDPRVKHNKELQAKVKAFESTTFGDLADHPAGDDVGTVRDTPQGKMRKVGENHWEPVQ